MHVPKWLPLLLLALLAAFILKRSGVTTPSAEWAPEVLQLNDDSFAVEKSKHPWALAVVTATWCGPCKTLKPKLNALAPQIAETSPVIALDYDTCTKTVDFYGLRGVPAMLILRNGKEVERQYGPMSAAAIKQWLDEVMAERVTPSS